MTLMPGGAREWNLVKRPSLSGISSLNRINSSSMLLMRRTRSFTSHVSYWAGMYLIAGLAPRTRLGDEPWLEEDDVFARVVEDAVAVWLSDGGGAVAERFEGICGSSAGSGGGCGGLGVVVPRRLPTCFRRSKADGTG